MSDAWWCCCNGSGPGTPDTDVTQITFSRNITYNDQLSATGDSLITQESFSASLSLVFTDATTDVYTGQGTYTYNVLNDGSGNASNTTANATVSLVYNKSASVWQLNILPEGSSTPIWQSSQDRWESSFDILEFPDPGTLTFTAAPTAAQQSFVAAVNAYSGTATAYGTTITSSASLALSTSQYRGSFAYAYRYRDDWPDLATPDFVDNVDINITFD